MYADDKEAVVYAAAVCSGFLSTIQEQLWGIRHPGEEWLRGRNYSFLECLRPEGLGAIADFHNVRPACSPADLA
jgi:hypothetical protein